jgi:hypothetical protein
MLLNRCGWLVQEWIDAIALPPGIQPRKVGAISRSAPIGIAELAVMASSIAFNLKSELNIA